jgi:hypothetical protein
VRDKEESEDEKPELLLNSYDMAIKQERERISKAIKDLLNEPRELAIP